MATVIELLDDIVMRLPLEVFQRYGEPGVLRTMNRIYKATNRDLQCLEKKTVINDGGGGSNPFDLPADYGKEFDIRDQNDDPVTYIDPDLFDEDEDGTYTIRQNKIEFGSLDATNDEFTLYYYSQGYTLVAEDASPVVSTEVTSPEWQNSHEFLYYAVVAELGGSLNSMELAQFKTFRENLARNQYDRQGSTPARTQPHSTSPKNQYIDDYEYPYTRHV